MDSSDAIRLIALIILFFLSAFFSSSETALTTVSRIKMRALADNKDKNAKIVLDLTSNLSKLLSAILIGNNIVNLTASSIATTLGIRIFGDVGAGIATGIVTLVVLIFGEIVPKNYSAIYAEKVSLKFAQFFRIFTAILSPVIFIINAISNLLLKIMGVDPSDNNKALTEDELKTIVDVSHERGVIESEERQMIHNVFDFDEAQAKEVMIPRIDVTMLSIDSTYDDIMDAFRENMHTRFPIYESSPDNIVGILNIKDLLLEQDAAHFSLRNHLRIAHFTYEHKNLSELLIEMRHASQSMSIVLDEYGDVSGLVTLEDLLEEIVGEIRDEYDTDEEDALTKIGDTEYIALGTMNLEDLGEKIGIPLYSEDYDSIGGYILQLLDHLPKTGDSITSPEGIFFRIEKMDKNRVDKIYIKLPAQDDISVS